MERTINRILMIILIILLAIAVALFVKDRIEIKKENNTSISEAENTNNQTENNISNTTGNNEIIEETDVSNDLFAEYYDEAEKLMETMTLKEKVGQMFFARYPDDGVIEEIKNENPGGYILFSKDFKDETKESIVNELNENQEASKIKLIFGVDEEGGTVVRVSSHKAFRNSKFQSPQELWAKGQLPAIIEDSKEKSELLKSLGLNMNLAPVADVPTKATSFIYERSYGRGTDKTATYIEQLIETMNTDNMISVMKHFPGYGDNEDTHTGIAIDERPYSIFENADFLPFKSGIEAGGPCILVSHNIVKVMDENHPASLSENVHKILREELGFTGIIMTDDLAMDAVKEYADNGEAAVQAVLAGNDMIISSNFTEQKQEVLNAIKDNRIDENTINIAVRRILAMKYAYGIIE